MVLTLCLSGCGLVAWPGKSCTKHEDCQGLKDGYCAKAGICTRECSETTACPENSTCTTLGKRSVCLVTCDSDDDCGLPNFVCYQNVCQVVAPLDPPPK